MLTRQKFDIGDVVRRAVASCLEVDAVPCESDHMTSRHHSTGKGRSSQVSVASTPPFPGRLEKSTTIVVKLLVETEALIDDNVMLELWPLDAVDCHQCVRLGLTI